MSLYKIKGKRFLWSDDQVTSTVIDDVNVDEIVVSLSKSKQKTDMIKVLTKQKVGFIYNHSLEEL